MLTTHLKPSSLFLFFSFHFRAPLSLEVSRWTVNFWSRESFTVCILSMHEAKRNSSFFFHNLSPCKESNCTFVLSSFQKKKRVKNQNHWTLRIAIIKRKRATIVAISRSDSMAECRNILKRLSMGNHAHDKGMPVFILIRHQLNVWLTHSHQNWLPFQGQIPQIYSYFLPQKLHQFCSPWGYLKNRNSFIRPSDRVL